MAPGPTVVPGGVTPMQQRQIGMGMKPAGMPSLDIFQQRGLGITPFGQGKKKTPYPYPGFQLPPNFGPPIGPYQQPPTLAPGRMPVNQPPQRSYQFNSRFPGGGQQWFTPGQQQQQMPQGPVAVPFGQRPMPMQLRNGQYGQNPYLPNPNEMVLY